ncbi:hypothetical protein FQN51_009177 [Onygenales sp. PD_10]|nr:hypothetical protein FQN51_009177 [Onygenales sp. PD_10]
MIIVGQLTANPGRRAEVDIWKRNSPISLRCQFPVLTGCQVVQKNGLTLAVPVAKCGTMGLILWQTIPSIKGSGALYGAHVSTTKLTRHIRGRPVRGMPLGQTFGSRFGTGGCQESNVILWIPAMVVGIYAVYLQVIGNIKLKESPGRVRLPSESNLRIPHVRGGNRCSF